MMRYKAIVRIYKQDREAKEPDESIEFAFVSGAKEYARDQVQFGKAKAAVVVDPNGTVLVSFPS